MVQQIITDPLLLGRKSELATKDDFQTSTDLLDTLRAHKDSCVGMAANMIGINRRIIVFDTGKEYITMFNPVILKSSDAYTAEEGCLSLKGIRKTKRYKSIKVQYQNTDFQTRIKSFTDLTAQIIQHEIDHCNGILI